MVWTAPVRMVAGSTAPRLLAEERPLADESLLAVQRSLAAARLLAAEGPLANESLLAYEGINIFLTRIFRNQSRPQRRWRR